jgi:hypothetical protein
MLALLNPERLFNRGAPDTYSSGLLKSHLLIYKWTSPFFSQRHEVQRSFPLAGGPAPLNAVAYLTGVSSGRQGPQSSQANKTNEPLNLDRSKALTK